MAVNFFINRLYVLTADGKVAYDECFHHGVNIIRGANSSGKSTVTRLLFFGLGGDYVHFVPEARSCSRVMVEISTDNATLTLSRPIDKNADGRVLNQRNMTVYWGTLDEALAGKCKSNTFGYKTSENRMCFSQILFGAMGMPIVQGDNNITMHQLLRLLYIDQESPTSSLFLYEQFDSQTTRETVADLLMGIFDEQLYGARIHLRKLETDISNRKSEIALLQKSLTKKMRSAASINSIIDSKNFEMEQISARIDQLRRDEEKAEKNKSQTDIARENVRTLACECGKLDDEIKQLELDIIDTQQLIAEIDRKQLALRHSNNTRQVLGDLHLAYCPECLAPLPDVVDDATCHLCRQPIDSKSGMANAKRLVAELNFHKMEAESILRQDNEELQTYHIQLRSKKAQLNTARKLLDNLLGNIRTTKTEAIEDLIYKKGVIKGELTQYYTLLELACRYEMLVKEKQQLEAEHTATRKLIDTKTAEQSKRRADIMSKMQEFGVYFLHNDKESQLAFKSAQPSDFMVDFPNNLVYLHDRNNKYSASSSFFLKLVARFSLFFASLDIPWMRYPRFIFADNMEDKGIEMERAQKFQTTLIEKLKEYDTDSYQVIYTTSYITDELDHSEYVVGDHYTMHNKSLKNTAFSGQ